MLLKRFRQSLYIIMISLLKELYTLRNTAARREPREFTQRILRTVKDVDINETLPQLDLIYTNINLNLRIFLQRLTENSTIDTFLTDLDDRKFE